MDKIVHRDRPALFHRISRLTSDPEVFEARLFHRYSVLLVILGGRTESAFADMTLRAGPGEAQLLPPNRHYRNRTFPGEPLDGYKILFTWRDRPLTGPMVRRDGTGVMRRLAEQLIAVAPPDRTVADARVTSYLLIGILGQLLVDDGELPHPLVRRLRDYVQAHMDRRITLNELADHLGYGKHYLVRKYRGVAGVTPMDAVRRIRLARAQHLVATTDLPVKAIAADIGLRDPAHLSRLFRRYFHISIRDMRAS